MSAKRSSIAATVSDWELAIQRRLFFQQERGSGMPGWTSAPIQAVTKRGPYQAMRRPSFTPVTGTKYDIKTVEQRPEVNHRTVSTEPATSVQRSQQCNSMPYALLPVSWAPILSPVGCVATSWNVDSNASDGGEAPIVQDAFGLNRRQRRSE